MVLIIKRILELSLLAFAFGGVALAQQMDYRDVLEGQNALIRHSENSPLAQRYVIGKATLLPLEINAIKISKNPDREDTGEKNAILFECGMHGNEWFAAESCYLFVDYLVANGDTELVSELLDHVDVWVIPQSNPGGRFIDDRSGGDPTAFPRFCQTGSKRGELCSDAADCPDGRMTTSAGSVVVPGVCRTKGWRMNADTSRCLFGVDPARNFSSGFGGGSNTCQENDPAIDNRGPAPFSELETLSLRRFVHNHMISMVVIMHSPSQKVTDLWANSSSASAHRQDQVALIYNNGLKDPAPSPSEIQLSVETFGRGNGQFSAWLTENSTHPLDTDLNTARNIPTVFIELPFISASYGDDYDGKPYRAATGDRSNYHHPSGNVVKHVFDDAIRPALLYLVRQARSPQCPIAKDLTREESHCMDKDIGLVGAKIAPSRSSVGNLAFDWPTRAEILPAGAYEIVFAIQNHSLDPNPLKVSYDIVVSKASGGTPFTANSKALLEHGERRVFEVPFDFEGGEVYQVSINLGPDDFTLDNEKIFKFRAVGFAQPRRIAPASPELQR